LLGKYGSLISYEVPGQPVTSDEGTVPVDELCRRLCQHIVGMNPRTIGEPGDESPSNPEEETRLLYQEYMHDTSLTVNDVLQQTGVKVLDFVRFECGEVLPEDNS
jgi:elongation factor Ts